MKTRSTLLDRVIAALDARIAALEETRTLLKAQQAARPVTRPKTLKAALEKAVGDTR